MHPQTNQLTINHSANLLHRLANGWDKRARVRTQPEMDSQFDLSKKDFLMELLPFHQHPLFTEAPDELKSKVLSCGWLLYNAKTIAIETDIVHPVCLSLLSETYQGVDDFTFKQLITETMVDEAYHIHLCSYANEITKSYRQINIRFPTFAFIKKMQAAQHQYAEPWKQSTIQLLTAITSEIYITDYLDLVHKEKTDGLQPLNSLIVKTHRSDELAHGKIFTHLTKTIFNHLSSRQKLFFVENLHKPIHWLVDPEFDVWLAILEQIKFPGYKQIILASREDKDNPIKELDKSIDDLFLLAQELGESNFSQETFVQEG